MSIEIRDACAEDHEDWLRLWSDYLTFYKVSIAEKVTAMTWARILDPMSPVTMRVAVRNLDVVGFATHHRHVSTWSVEPRCYLEDLFVAPEYRCEGIGSQLIDDVIAISRRDGCKLVYWHTKQDNETARRVYDVYGPADPAVKYAVRFEK